MTSLFRRLGTGWVKRFAANTETTSGTICRISAKVVQTGKQRGGVQQTNTARHPPFWYQEGVTDYRIQAVPIDNHNE